MAVDILVIDDENDICSLIADILEDEGYTARTAKDGVSALAEIKQRRPALVLLDVWLGDGERDGFKVLEIIKRDHNLVPVIMMSGHGTIETAVNAIKHGAYDFLEKPFNTEKLLLTISRALESAQLKRENRELKVKSGISLLDQDKTLAHTPKIQHHVDEAIKRRVNFYIYGEEGTGKENVAREIHIKSGLKGEFNSLSCASLNEIQFNAELFGTEIQSESQADIPRKIGLVERSHNGTLYLEDIDLLPKTTQTKLIHFLTTSQFCRVGSQTLLKSSVRIIGTSTQDPKQLVQDGHLNADLFYRLSSIVISIPPLRERSTEIPDLLEKYLLAACQSMGEPPRKITKEASILLQSYSWPGNLDQLKNMIEWILIMDKANSGAPITKELLPEIVMSGNHFASEWQLKSAGMIVLPLREARETFEKEYLLTQIKRFEGNISQTARFIGMERSALHRKLRTLGVADYKATA